MNGWTNERMNEWTKERMNEGTNEGMRRNEGTKERRNCNELPQRPNVQTVRSHVDRKEVRQRLSCRSLPLLLLLPLPSLSPPQQRQTIKRSNDQTTFLRTSTTTRTQSILIFWIVLI